MFDLWDMVIYYEKLLIVKRAFFLGWKFLFPLFVNSLAIKNLKTSISFFFSSRKWSHIAKSFITQLSSLNASNGEYKIQILLANY